MAERLIRRAEVLRITGLPKSSLYDKIERGEFPAPVPMGVRAVAWVESEVEAWIENAIAQRGAA